MTGWQDSFSMLKYCLLFLDLIHNLMFQWVFKCDKQTFKANTPEEKEDALYPCRLPFEITALYQPRGPLSRLVLQLRHIPAFLEFDTKGRHLYA